MISEAYSCAETIILNHKDVITKGADILKRDNVLRAETMAELIKNEEITNDIY